MKKHIIIIHEIYGITKNLVELKALLEKSGYTVSLPSLYTDNYTGFDEAYSYEKFYSQVGIEKSYNIINKEINKIPDSDVILLGFSIGATIAWLHSNNDRIKSVIGIYGSRIRNYLNIVPTVKTNLFFCNEEAFNVEEVNSALNHKTLVSSEIIPGKHGFYGKLSFSHFMINKLNTKILEILLSSM